MHRLGFAPDAAREAHARLRAARGVTGDIVLMSHFATPDEFDGVSSDSRQTREQLQVFPDATAGLPGPRSPATSPAVLGGRGCPRAWGHRRDGGWGKRVAVR